jgi:hypothetical protein
LKEFFRTIVPATLKLLGATAYRRAHVHTGKSKEEILGKLKTCGFFSEGLPECVGGTWTYDNFSKWQTERRRIEEETHLITDVYKQKSQEPKSLVPIPKRLPASFIAVSLAEEREQIEPRKRTRNSIYSSAKRERQKSNVQALHDESKRLTLSNVELKKDNDFLEGLLAAAEAAIAPTEHLVPPTIPGRAAQHGAYAQQPPLGLSASQGVTYEQQTPLGLSTSGVTCARNRLPGLSSFANIDAVLGLQRSVEEQKFHRDLAKRSFDSLLIGGQHDVIANRAALLTHQSRQQLGQLQSSDFAASTSLLQATAIAPGTFYTAEFSSAVGASRLPVSLSNPPAGYASQNVSQAPLGQYPNDDLHRWLQQQSPNFPGAPPRYC